MATYVMMVKKYEDEEKVVYQFGPDETRLGSVEIMKKTAQYKQLEPVPECQSTFYFNATVSKLLKYLKENPNKEFPGTTFYAS